MASAVPHALVLQTAVLLAIVLLALSAARRQKCVDGVVCGGNQVPFKKRNVRRERQRQRKREGGHGEVLLAPETTAEEVEEPEEPEALEVADVVPDGSGSDDACAYGRALLLAHRTLQLRIARGPPGLELSEAAAVALAKASLGLRAERAPTPKGRRGERPALTEGTDADVSFSVLLNKV